VLDPHGDLVEQILAIIPEKRIKDVVLLDLSDTEFPVGFNILQAHSEDEKALLSSDLVAVFRRFSTSWGDQMDIVLHNAILVFLESKQGGTLVDLRNFLSGTQAYRERILQAVTDREVVHFWREIFPKLGAGKSIGSVLIRLQNFFSRKPLRNMVSQRDNKLDFANIMDSGKIFLAKLPEGLNGAENVYLLGSLLVSKFQQTAMTRQNQLAADRKDFWLYVDEFDHFISPSMAAIITGARKYRLGMTLAHQELHQLQSEPKVASAVNTSVCTRIVLRVGDDDAKKLAERFESFDAKSLKNLEKYHAVARIERDDWDFNLALPKPELPSSEQAAKRTAEVVAASRATYATPRAEVEAAWLTALGIDMPSDSGNTPTPPKPEKPKPTPPANEQPSPKPAEPAQPAPVVTETPKASEVPKPAEIPKVVMPEPAPVASAQGVSQEPTLPRESGRGLALHKAMQKRIAMAARKAGFDADPEKQLLKGSQKAADVMLRMGEVKIAVEIALPDSGSVNHEFDNVQKCFAADFARVVVVSTERKRLDTIAAAVRGGLDAGLAAKVSYHLADEFIAGLPAFAAEFKTSPLPPGEDNVDGLIVGSNFPALTDEAKEKSNYRLMAEILRRKSKSKGRKV
jgi:outer membrane biosynthesis protein TonB